LLRSDHVSSRSFRFSFPLWAPPCPSLPSISTLGAMLKRSESAARACGVSIQGMPAPPARAVGLGMATGAKALIVPADAVRPERAKESSRGCSPRLPTSVSFLSPEGAEQGSEYISVSRPCRAQRTRRAPLPGAAPPATFSRPFGPDNTPGATMPSNGLVGTPQHARPCIAQTGCIL